jgi:hypothetical protein
MFHVELHIAKNTLLFFLILGNDFSYTFVVPYVFFTLAIWDGRQPREVPANPPFDPASYKVFSTERGCTVVGEVYIPDSQ